MASEVQGENIIGFVATFDDITELVIAQRAAAWSDVARRVAHEIKNPLTPIQLSAERLKRKYFSEITTDPQTFADCTDTIIRQVDDIGRLVKEFSSFARSPEPQIRLEDIVEICRQAIILPQHAHPEIDFETELPETPPKDSVRPGTDFPGFDQSLAEFGGRHTGEKTAGRPEDLREARLNCQYAYRKMM